MVWRILWLIVGAFILSSTDYKTTAFINLEGQEVLLEEYEGCYVFISFWSKSCGPCIMGFKRHRTLRQRLIDEGVVILNVSIDNKEDWLRAYQKHEPNGLNVLVKDFELVQEEYEIYALPVYVTLDPAGNLVTYDKHLRENILDFAEWYGNRRD